MEHAEDIVAIEPEDVTFDGIEIAGLVVPLLFAIMAIALVALTPDSAGTASKDLKTESQRVEFIEQIRKR